MSASDLSNGNIPRRQRPKQHQYILPKCITADVGLSISRQLAKWIQDDHELEVLILRGPASQGNNLDVATMTANANNHVASVEDGGIPPYLIGLLQDLIMTKASWKRIELSGRAPRATERILQSTMIQREGVAPESARKTSHSRADRKMNSNKNMIAGDGYVHELDKLVIENASVQTLTAVSTILSASAPQLHSSEEVITGTTDIHTLALRWTDFSVACVQALSRGLVVSSSPTTKLQPHPLRGLLLTGSTIQGFAIPLIAQMLQFTTSLEELSLTDCHLEDQEAAVIIDALHESSHPRLLSLDMSSNLLQEQAILALARLTRKRSTLLTRTAQSSTCEPSMALLTVDISNQDVWDSRSYVQPLIGALAGVASGIAENKAETIGHKTPVVTAIDCMYWSHNWIEDFHIQQLCGCFTRAMSLNNTVNLRKLVLRGNMIQDEGVEYIAEALPSMLHLQYLDLRLNPKITENAADKLAVALRELHSQPDSRDRAPTGRSLWHIFLDLPTQSFMIELSLHRAGKSWLLRQEEKALPLPANLWPLVFERVMRCIQPQQGDLDEEICIHGVFCVDLMFDLFRLGYSSFLDCR